MKYLKLLRVKHWIKNLLMFFPIVFSGKLGEKDILINLLIGFLAFCTCASTIYIYNDIKDVDKDRKHPTKRKRPIASGEVSKKTAITLLIIFLFLTITILLVGHFSLYVWGGLGLYQVINIAYSKKIKNVPLLDVVILGGGYLIRLFMGGYLAKTGVSDWMFLTVFSAVFFLGFGKRRNELIKYDDTTRDSLKKYNEKFLDRSVQLFLSLTIVFYSLCCIDENTAVAQRGINFLWTVPIVILICLRYCMVLENDVSDGDPIEIVSQDKFLIGMIFFYGVMVLGCMYIK